MTRAELQAKVDRLSEELERAQVDLAESNLNGSNPPLVVHVEKGIKLTGKLQGADQQLRITAGKK